MPHDRDAAQLMLDLIEREAIGLGMKVMATREVPVNNEDLGKVARDAEPRIVQIFVSDEESDDPMEIRLYMLRKIVKKKIAASAISGKEEFYIVSLSSRVIVYKGVLSSLQLRYYFPDLMNPRFTTAMALVHSRFSTNTFPSWSLAQPFRMLGHNGEINTIQGNRLWMKARECLLSPPQFAGHDMTPIIQPGISDSASLDNVLEFFVMAGMSLPHALAMLVPESFNDKNPISAKLKAFYEYHSIQMEAWDGPATLLFSDGRYAGGMLDRNGLRPARWVITDNNTVVIASESGVLPFAPSEIRAKGRLRPGKMMMVDMKEGRIYHDHELKEMLAMEHPYRDWLQLNRINLDNIRSGRKVSNEVAEYRRLLSTFGYHLEEKERIILPMVKEGREPIHSMGKDTPQPLFSRLQQPLYNYFRQHFAQVTNPPIDPLREELVMSLDSYIGTVNLSMLDFSPKMCKMVLLRRPIITNRELELLCNLRYKGFNTRKLPMTFSVADGPEGLEPAIERLCREAEQAVDDGCNYLILTDRGVDADHAPIPALLATSAVHHHLIDKKKRMQTALVVETASAREVMHFALLVGYGASAVNPYLAFALIDDMVKRQEVQLDFTTASRHFVEAVDKGLLKVMSKMGISTLTSYKGAELFEALGLSKELCSRYFGATPSSNGGIGVKELAAGILRSHTEAFDKDFDTESPLPLLGEYKYRKSGESHAWNPHVIATLQKSTRNGDLEQFREFCRAVDEKEEPIFIRDFLEINTTGRKPVALDEVESEESIMHRLVAGAMSFWRDIT